MSITGGPRIVTDNLVLHLDAGNVKSYVGTGSNWVDRSGSYNNATLSNLSYTASNNGAILFGTSSNGVVNFPTITFTNQPYTIEFCGNINSVLNSSNRRSIFGIPSYAGEFSDPVTYFTNITVDSVPSYFNFGFPSAGSIATSSNIHWAFTLDSSKRIMIYLNGNPISTYITSLTSYTNITTSFSRFGLWSVSRPYIGSLYMARIYSKALSIDEVKQNFNSIKSRLNI